jgi:hypothetical protein
VTSLVAALLASAAALASAEDLLAKGQPARVLATLEATEAVAEDERVAAGRLLCAGAELARDQKDTPLARRLAERAAEVDRFEARPLQLLAEWAVADRDLASARRHATRWLERAPDDPEARALLARLGGQPPKPPQPRSKGDR